MTTIAGKGLRTEGFMEPGDRIGWTGSKFGLPTRHVSRIARFEPPSFFREVMESGSFSRFEHDHHFTTVGDHTLVLDYIRFSMPLWLAGRVVGRQVVLPHVVDLLRTRLGLLKRLAEGEEWRKYLPDDAGTAQPIL
jgi:ligand-binding SRPBCC domain-containing protein